jgi:hypothetical protein
MIKTIVFCDECGKQASRNFFAVNYNGNGIQKLTIYENCESCDFHICSMQCLIKFISKKLEKGVKND